MNGAKYQASLCTFSDSVSSSCTANSTIRLCWNSYGSVSIYYPFPAGNFHRGTRRMLASLKTCTMKVDSIFASAPRIPKDAIFALTAQYTQDPSPAKVNLGQGAYRDNEAQPWILPSVAEARRRVFNRKLDHEYLPILGLAEFRDAASRLVMGSSNYASMSSRVCQTCRRGEMLMVTDSKLSKSLWYWWPPSRRFVDQSMQLTQQRGLDSRTNVVKPSPRIFDSRFPMSLIPLLRLSQEVHRYGRVQVDAGKG